MSAKLKAFYNKFSHKLRAAPEAIKAKWSEVKALKDASKKQAFFDALMGVGKGGDYTIVDKVFQQVTSVVDKIGETARSGWVPFKQFADKHGEDAVLAMVELRTVDFQPNPSLAGSAIRFPRDQFFWNEVKEYQSERYKQDTSNLAGENRDLEAETASTISHCMGEVGAQFVKKAAAAKVESQPSLAGACVGVREAVPPPPPGDGSVLSQLRKVHADFDRKKRQYMLIKTQADKNSHTAGTHLASSLSAAIDAGTQVDAQLLDFEIQLTTDPADADLADAEEKVSQNILSLLEWIAKGGKYAKGLKTLLKMDS